MLSYEKVEPRTLELLKSLMQEPSFNEPYLTYFEDAEMQPMPKMFDKTSWADMQKAIIEEVKLLQ